MTNNETENFLNQGTKVAKVPDRNLQAASRVRRMPTRPNPLNLTWDWRNRIVTYLQDDVLPSDKKEAKKLRMQIARYSIIHNDLYKRTYGAPLAKYLGPNQTRRILEEVHEGNCGAHSGNRALIRCLIRAGYYWPRMKKRPRTS
uniref:Integrase zinc-binding domain-containing protein n=1 Tax=Nicotiana tabacum TaxID=4097 RepID=A0A1S4BV67_TOBAC|nr:PREDICTED: uncharacterized protein LOC107812226 [Nicotiana tabacum]